MTQNGQNDCKSFKMALNFQIIQIILKEPKNLEGPKEPNVAKANFFLLAEFSSWRHDIQHNDTQHSDTEHNNTPYNDTQNNGRAFLC
jgi:hypothetical protein